MINPRRKFVQSLAALFAGAALQSRAQAAPASGNFQYIYSDVRLRTAFKNFLANVFHLYPQDDFDALIRRSAASGASDEQVYRAVQAKLSTIKPFLGDLRYSLPALAKQKRVLGGQTRALLDTRRRYDGYLEVGSNGRFLDALEEHLEIRGPRITLSDVPPSMSPVDLVDRGQFSRDPFVALNGYQPRLSSKVPPGSLDLITVYIGFHHCPIPLRGAFFGMLRDALRPGGVMIVRDHDVRIEDMRRMVGLAHDVFNLGTQQSWAYNAAERRHFYSLDDLDRMLGQAGFARQGGSLLQTGDPTQNTLRRYARA